MNPLKERQAFAEILPLKETLDLFYGMRDETIKKIGRHTQLGGEDRAFVTHTVMESWHGYPFAIKCLKNKIMEHVIFEDYKPTGGIEMRYFVNESEFTLYILRVQATQILYTKSSHT